MKDNSMQNGTSLMSGKGQMNASDNDILRGAADQTGMSGKAMIAKNNNLKNVGGEESTNGSGFGGSEADQDNNSLVGTSGGDLGTTGNLSGGAGGGTGISVEDDDDTRMGTSSAEDARNTSSD